MLRVVEQVAKATVGSVHYLLGVELALWLLVVADDLVMFVTRGHIRE